MKWSVCFLSVLVALLSVSVSGHQWKFGKCISTPRKSDLDTQRFLGSWFVIEQIDTSSECLTLNYERKSSSQLQVTKVRQHPLIKRLGVKHTNKYTGTLDVPTSNQARMRVKWKLNPLKSDYTIVDTDYDTYALIFECQQLTPLNHRYSAAILSRDSTLSEGTVTEMKTILQKNGVNTSKFNKVDHSPCTPKTTTTEESTTEVSTTTSTSSSVTPNPTPERSDPTPEGSATERPDQNPGREPLDENPVVPDGNPDEIPDVDIDETLDDVDESINYIDGTNSNGGSEPRSFPDDNPASPPSEPEVPVEDPAVPPREPEAPVEDPVVPVEDTILPVNDVRRTVVSGI